jgi:hypothetical protein
VYSLVEAVLDASGRSDLPAAIALAGPRARISGIALSSWRAMCAARA